MAVKKTELYSSLWASCDALRGGMDASQYKDYVLTLLFMKYVTDKYKGQKYADIKVFDKAHDANRDPDKRTGCSFDDFIALKNQKNIGEGIDKVIARLAEENESLKGVIDIAHFNDEAKIGKGQEMVDKLTKLIAIFQRPELDFSKNRAEGDDIIGDAYEYLMRNFATESGKSKGQFYTPAEVSRILAQVIGIDKCMDRDATICDPACGSGSLLIRALTEAPFEIAGYGQEKESSTAGLAKMNAVLHNKPTIKIMSGNTFSDPQFLKADDASELERFDYIVANPPFSLKNWSDGLKEYGRFIGYGDRPPEKNGDYAWLMHILKTLKSTGKAAVILPHGVLFRGNAERTIRKTIVDKGWIKGIISLPANLFYGTGIAACIMVIDKEGADNRAGIFMIDAGKEYVKDGNKNRLRERDIYRIVTTFNQQIETDPKYARFVPNKEIKEKNDYNLNISRYIDSSEPEDVQDIYAHIHGGIPKADIDSLWYFWNVFPKLKESLLDIYSDGYYKVIVEEDQIRPTIFSDQAFIAYGEKMDEAFLRWKAYADKELKMLKSGVSAKKLIERLAKVILAEFESLTLIDTYSVYQVLLAYWNEVLGDDVSLIISEDAGYGVARETENITKETKKKDADGNPERKVVGWEGKLIPKDIVISKFFLEEKRAIEELTELAAETDSRLEEMIEESEDDSILADISDGGRVKSKDIKDKMAEIKRSVHTPAIDALVEFQNVFPKIKRKADYMDYIGEHILCKSAYADTGTVTKASIAYALDLARLEAPVPEAYEDEYRELEAALELAERSENTIKMIKALDKELDIKVRERYAALTDDEIMELLVNRKWYYAIGNGINDLYMAVSHQLADRIIELSRRYENTLPDLLEQVSVYENKVKQHLERMGFTW
ncbi:MAG: type I restriction-modification system subunit M [Blautia sp.]|nr:type I restriction-modification system subunit M [Blautia sp.]